MVKDKNIDLPRGLGDSIIDNEIVIEDLTTTTIS